MYISWPTIYLPTKNLFAFNLAQGSWDWSTQQPVIIISVIIHNHVKYRGFKLINAK